MKEMIERLVNAYGPSGYEAKIRTLIEDEIKGHADDIETDPLGNLIAFKKGDGGGKRIMIAAHMDEIGVIVTHIDDKGFLRFAAVGGVNAQTILGHRVVFENGTLGVVGSEKVDSPADLKLDRLFIDIGAEDKAGAQKKVSVGDMAGFYHPMQEMGQRLVSKTMDDRIGCAVAIETMKRMKDSPNDCYFVFTVQEEVGLRGARTSAFAVDPEIGIALDVTRTGDTPKATVMDVSLGKGAAIKVKDSSVICHVGVKNLMVKTAQEHKIAYQLEVLEGGGTDSGAIHMTREGVPSGVISIPSRYVHSQSEMVDIRDVNACVDLLVKILEQKIEI